MQEIHTKLFVGMTHITIIITLTCALFLWLQRDEGERSRRILSWIWFGCAAIFFLRLIVLYRVSMPHSDGLLAVPALLGGFVAITILFAYPVEIISPLWLNRRRLLLLFSPVIFTILVVVAMRLCGIEFRTLHNIKEIAEYWYEPNVLIRFFVVFEIFAYSFVVFYIPHNKARCNTTLTWVYSFVVGIQGVSILYFCNMFFGLIPMGIFHQLYYLIFLCYITYQELFLRLFIVPSSDHVEQRLEPETTIIYSKPLNLTLSEQLAEYMEREEPWRNPNLTLPILAQALHTSRTTLSQTIQSSDSDFYDYVAGYRIRAFCAEAQQGKVVSIQETFFKVGFRNRATALNQFKKQIGTTPSEYLKSIYKQK